MLITRFLSFISITWRNTRRAVARFGYTDFTIAELFRKQGARIGEGCRFQVRSLGTEPWLVTIGNHVSIASRANLHTHNGGDWLLKEQNQYCDTFGTITIEDNCFIGMAAQILPNVHIGRNSIIGAGSVVINDIPPDSIVMGVPARVVGSSKKYREKQLALWREQRPPVWPLDEAKDYWHVKEDRKILRQHLVKLFEQKRKEKESGN